jgi:uncharacterized protein YdeI (YjbR/CyaY-like superfamily)
MPAAPKPRFFRTPEEFRAWLEERHASATEQWVGYYKKGSGRPSMTWPESVDEALCFGWIDGIRKSIDAERYTIRFTPRKATSTWSAVNVARVAELERAGRMHPAGQAAFASRATERTGTYSYENRHKASLSPEQERRFRRNRRAWAFFEQQPPGYRRTMVWWVVSAKRPETRERRLASLIEHSAAGKRIPAMAGPSA